MKTLLQADGIRAIHPFPARMAPAVVRDLFLRHSGPALRVLDPMAGSGTTLAVARAHGHTALGLDTDPLAVLIASVWISDINDRQVSEAAMKVAATCKASWQGLPRAQAYPRHADEETRAFVRYWFDDSNRRQLAVLAQAISRIRTETVRRVLWCAFSRLLITKQAGASLAMDTAHSRPHRVYNRAPISAVHRFQEAVSLILRSAPFRSEADQLPGAIAREGDARQLQLPDDSVDLVVTSPPYLNAIDYLRGHKFSLIWMGYSLAHLRSIRASNIGTEVSVRSLDSSFPLWDVLNGMTDLAKLPSLKLRMLARYLLDMNSVISEISRVLVRRGRAVLVVGDSTISEVFVETSKGIMSIAEQNGLQVTEVQVRALPSNRRYLPPPCSRDAGKQLAARMRNEVIVTLTKS